MTSFIVSFSLLSIFRVTTFLVNLGMLGNLTIVRELAKSWEMSDENLFI